MPTSRKRQKRSNALSGIPQTVIALAPRDWPDARKSQWCRAYLKGASGAQMGKIDRNLIVAFRQGARDAGQRTSEVAQVAAVDRSRRLQADRYEEERRIALGSQRSFLESRLDALSGLTTIDGARGMALAAASALGLGFAVHRDDHRD